MNCVWGILSFPAISAENIDTSNEGSLSLECAFCTCWLNILMLKLKTAENGPHLKVYKTDTRYC